MKRVLSIVIICFLLSTTVTFADSKISDVLYFPWGDKWINRSKDTGSDTPTDFGKFYWKYNLFYFWTKQYESSPHKRLFSAILKKLKTQYKLQFDIIAHYETRDELEKKLEEQKLEIKVAKFRYQNNSQANADEKDIILKLDKIVKQNFESIGKTNAGLQRVTNIDEEICWENISSDFSFHSVYLKWDDIKSYYLFGHRWWDWAIYGSPWDKNNKSKAFIISKEEDLKNIDKSKFFLYKVNPTFKEVKYTESYSNTDEEVYVPKWWAVLTQVEVYERVLSTNKEANFTLKYSDYFNYFKKNNNLFQFQNIYTFWSWDGTKRSFQLMLLWVENDWDVRILTWRNTSVEFDLSTWLNGLKFKEVCDNYFQIGKNWFETNDKKIYYTKQKIVKIFEKLDTKFNIQAYKDFKYWMNHQDMLVEEEYYNKVMEKDLGKYKAGYKKYILLLNKLSAKIEKIDTKIENDIYNILVDSKANVIKNKSKLKKRYYLKAIIKALQFEIKKRKSLLSKDY